MKTMTASALALCLVFLAIGCGEAKTQGPAADILSADNKVEATVTGMDCSACSSALCTAIEKIDGVEKAHADVKSGKVIVALKEGTDAKATEQLVSDAIIAVDKDKYTVTELTSTTKGKATAPAGDEAKACLADCTKDCCKKADGDEQVKACPADCTKPCCQKVESDAQVQATVTGMHCSACSSELCLAIEKVQGVQKAHADAKTGKVTVALKEGTDAKAAEQLISAAILAVDKDKYAVTEMTSTTAADAKACPAGCTKPCCADGDKPKACPANCDKPCCKPAKEAA